MPKKTALEPEAKAIPPTPDMGTVTERLARPEHAGDITAAEALEIRARNELIKQLDEDVQRASRLVNVVRNEKFSFVDRLLVRYGLDPKNQYSIDDASGAISLVARTIAAQPEIVATEESAPAENE